MSAVKSEQPGDDIGRAEASWLLAVAFAGLGAGFVMLILTLSTTYAIVLCALGTIIVWPLASNKKGRQFALQSTGIYIACAMVGIAVGWASTFGTGLPVVMIQGLVSI